MSKRILVLTNMGPSRDNPYQGQFVFRQADALRNRLPKSDKVRVFSMPSWLGSKPSWFKYPLWFCWFLLTQSWRRYTHVHVHFFMPTAVLAVAYKKLHRRVRLFATFHGTDVYAYVPPSKRYVALLGYFERLIFVSEKLKNRLTDYVVGDRMTVLSAGIPDVFSPPEEDSARPVSLLFVGNLNHNKGGDRLLELAGLLPSSQTLVVAGEGEYKQPLQQLAESQSNITIVGAQTTEQLLDWYRQSRWVINLSRNESFGLVMTEAMACGTPVLATRTDGADEQVENGVNGYVVSQDHYDELLSLSDVAPQEWALLSKGARNAAQQHRLEHITQRLLSFYS